MSLKQSRKTRILAVILMTMILIFAYWILKLGIFTYKIYTLESKMRDVIYPGARVNELPDAMIDEMLPIDIDKVPSESRSDMNGHDTIYTLEKGHMIYYFTTSETSGYKSYLALLKSGLDFLGAYEL